MKKMRLRFAALILTAAVLLSGCDALDLGGYFRSLWSVLGGGSGAVAYADMTYERPDMTELLQTLDAACQTAEGEDLDAIMNGIYDFYDAYDWFYTCYSLADIRYCADLTDAYWEQENTWFAENSPTVDAALEELYYALAKSPCRAELESEEYFGSGYFDSYDGENLWDETFTAMLEQESQLQNRYYELSMMALDYDYGTEAYYDACAGDMAGLLVELIALRQQIADYWGYPDYPSFANDFSYYRDYTVEQTEAYFAGIRQELVPLYRQMNQTDIGDWAYDYCSESGTLNYVRQAAYNMGGTIQEAFELMESAGLYDISYGKNKYNSSFEVYLYSYTEPFIFMNPQLVNFDCLTLAHEFGHFCNDYASYGSYGGVDVLEVFSQGMEYLSLCYGEDTETLTRVKMADSLSTYVEQAAFASFEEQMYGLTGDALSVEGLYALYDEIALSCGFDSVGYDRREFVTITHLYTNPMYIISYVVSNDAAMQLYQLEQAEQGAGLKKMQDNLDSQEAYFLAFLEAAGLESPFTEGRLTQVRQTFESVLE